MKFVRFLIKLLIVAALGTAGFYGWQEWKKFEVVLTGLQEKHPEKYEKMVAEFKEYNFDIAKKLYYELDAMTPNEVTWLRYNKLKKKWTENEEFRFEHMKERFQFRKEENKRMDIVYKKRADIVEHFGDDQAEWLPVKWQQLEPWEKGEMLREHCVRYLELAIEEDRERQNLRNLPKHTSLLKKTTSLDLTPSVLCEKWVPLGRNESIVEASLGTLQEKLNYSHYKEMLERLGIPVDETFSFPHRFRRLTAELAG